jgi:hypothetical protein
MKSIDIIDQNQRVENHAGDDGQAPGPARSQAEAAQGRIDGTKGGDDIASYVVATAPSGESRDAHMEDDVCATPAFIGAADAPPQASTTPSVATPSAATPSVATPSAARRRPTSVAKAAANRANSQQSTGPRTEDGKRRASRNAAKYHSARLWGEVESRTLGQQPGAAEELYRELIRPYEPLPAILEIHFRGLAREQLELEAWEGIRDAQLEEGWRQNTIERRRRLHALQADLPGTAEELFAQGLQRMPDSPARAKKQLECLEALEQHLARRDFDIGPMLRMLYGNDLNPSSDRAQTICIRCDRLMKARDGGEPLGEEQFEGLLDLLALEERDALAAYALHLDQASMPQSASRARLGATQRDRAMSLQGERLRQAIDRKQRVITSLLRALGLHHAVGNYDSLEIPADPASKPFSAKKTKKKNLKFNKTKPLSPAKSTKRPQKQAKTKPNEAKLRRPPGR